MDEREQNLIDDTYRFLKGVQGAGVPLSSEDREFIEAYEAEQEAAAHQRDEEMK